MQADRQTLGPLKVLGSLHETIWGGQRLREIAGKDLPADRLIGESWETAIDSRVVEGPCVGRTLGEVVEEYGAEFLGRRAVEVYGTRFPLLAKFIDAHQWLSVQAHPNDAYAAEHEHGKLGKTETWYILHAAPGAQIIYGVNRPVAREDVRAAIEATQLEELLLKVEVASGDVVFVPAGAIHAIGAGVALYELQEYSDITYRLYDYGRVQANGQPRELHIERALDVISYAPPARVKATPLTHERQGPVERRTLVACEYFVEDEFTLHGGGVDLLSAASVQALTVIEGVCALRRDGAPEMRLSLGETAVLPASPAGYTVSGDARVIRAYVPEADDALVPRWRAAQEG